MLWAKIDARPTVVVLSNDITVHVAVLANDEATWIRLRPEDLFLSLYRLGRVRRTFQATEVFAIGGERFDFPHVRCVGGGEQGGYGRELLEHRLFVGGDVVQVIKIALEFLVLDGLSS